MGNEIGIWEATAASLEDASPGKTAGKRRSMTRRTAIGVCGIAVASLIMWRDFAYAGVGGGAWGSEYGTAAPGNNFGYDGNWGYSSDWTCWIAVSSDASIGRMTELYLNISISAFYANGGIWSPTWFEDFPDTHVQTWVRNEGTGETASLTYSWRDTKYDSNSFHGPYCTDTHRVGRKSSDWLANTGVHVWCDSDDNANGIDISEWGHQYIPHHVLVDNTNMRGRIVTMRPHSALALHMDVGGGGRQAGANVLGWELTNTTNQNWYVGQSAQGRTCFVPIHTCENMKFLDVSGGDWNDGDNIQIWNGNGGLAQSYYNHLLSGTDDGYHMLVPECSGCAVDLQDGYNNGKNGNNIAQYNCYGNWSNGNQHWLLQDVVFHERTPGSLPLSGLQADGTAAPGTTLAPGDPASYCVPTHWGQDRGIYYVYSWYRSVETAGTAQVFGQGHIQGIGENYGEQQADVFIGSAGLGCRLEALTLHLRRCEWPGTLHYQVYVDGVGWQEAKAGGELAGTTGQGRALKRIKIWLDGEASEHYDIRYRLHCSEVGWRSDEASNGAETGGSENIESVMIWLVRSDMPAWVLVSGQSENPGYVVQESDTGHCLTCVVNAKARSLNVQYFGDVRLPSAKVADPVAHVRFFADRESSPCYSCDSRKGEPFSVPAAANDAATNPSCSGLDGWYVDPAYVAKFADGTALDADIDLYARNRVDIAYANARDGLPSGDSFSTTRGGTPSSLDAASGLPPAAHLYYGDTLSFAEVANREISYTADGARWFDLHAEGGWHLAESCSDSSRTSIKLNAAATVWKKWESSTFDGIREDAN